MYAAARTYEDQRDDQRFVVQIVNDVRVRLDKRSSEVYPLAGIPGADLQQSFFIHLNHVQLEIRPEPLVVELNDARQTAYFDLHTAAGEQNKIHRVTTQRSYKYQTKNIESPASLLFSCSLSNCIRAATCRKRRNSTV